MSSKITIQRKARKGVSKRAKKTRDLGIVVLKQKQGLKTRGTRGYTPMEMMIMDPCNSPTEPVQQAYMEGGIVFRVRTRYPIHQTNTANAGMFLWDPTYFNGGTDGTFVQIGGAAAAFAGSANLYMYETNSAGSATAPLNTVTSPLGSGVSTTSVTGRCLPDPAYNTLVGGGGIYSAATLIGACLHMGYTGPTSANSGEVCFISNYPSSNLIGAATNLPSVQQLLTYGRRPVRVGSHNELIYRPNDLADRMRTVGQTCATGGSLTGLPSTVGFDAALSVGKPGTSESVSGLDTASKMFGLAWVNLNSSQASDCYIECTKIFQVQVRAQSGQQEPSPAIQHAVSSQAAVEAIDRKYGNTSWDWIGELAARGLKAGLQIHRGYSRASQGGASRLTNLALGGFEG